MPGCCFYHLTKATKLHFTIHCHEKNQTERRQSKRKAYFCRKRQGATTISHTPQHTILYIRGHGGLPRGYITASSGIAPLLSCKPNPKNPRLHVPTTHSRPPLPHLHGTFRYANGIPRQRIGTTQQKNRPQRSESHATGTNGAV